MKAFIAKYGTALAGLVLVIALSLIARNFISPNNILTVLKQASFLVILSIGFTFALMTSELDLSFASLCSLAAVITGAMLHAGIFWPWALLAGLGLGMSGGLLNSFFVTFVKIPSLIATLGTSTIAGGIAFMATGGISFVGRFDATFLNLARSSLLGIPNLVLIMAVIVLMAVGFSTQMKTGLHMLMTGEAGEAARRAGISTASMKILGLTLSGLCAGITAVLLVANLSSAAPEMAGDFLMNGIAAVLLGMTMFDPGRPNILGSFVGALMISILGNGLVLLGAPYYLQDIMLGLIILASVSVSASTIKKAALSI